jgi:hypothetical protein
MPMQAACKDFPGLGEPSPRLPSLRWLDASKEITMPQQRERIDTGTDKRFVRRDEQGQFKVSTDVGRSLAADRRKHAKTGVPKGQGDRGDQKKS